jgi:hypothetical protein
MDLMETGWDDMDWINLVEDMDRWWALAKTVMNLREVPSNVEKLLSNWATGDFSRT